MNLQNLEIELKELIEELRTSDGDPYQTLQYNDGFIDGNYSAADQLDKIVKKFKQTFEHVSIS